MTDPVHAVLKERARRLAERHPGQQAVPELPTHFVFQSGGHRFVLALDELEAVAPGRITLVPLAPPWLLGLTAYRDGYRPVLCLGTGPVNLLLFLRSRRVALPASEAISLEFRSAPTAPAPGVELPPGLSVSGVTEQGWLVLEVA